ncbi:MAG: D-alanine--D-alanine ligase [Anaerolineales bacterium]|nr:D-alanine--D-alanine ligase [Anaerolineales bacterium]
MTIEIMDKINIGVIFGGRSGEHEVSLMSARSVLDALDQERYKITQIGISHDGEWLVGENILEKMTEGKIAGLSSAAMFPDPSRQGLFLIKQTQSLEVVEHLVALDVVFPVLHGTFGEDGTLQGFLEMVGVAYVGAGVLGSSVGMDKGVFREVMLANGIPVVDTMVVLRSEIDKNIDQVASRAEQLTSYPMFVKPANTGSSVGVSKCHSRSDLIEGMLDAARFDRRILVQRAVNAREIEVSVLGNDLPEASIPGEIRPAAEFYSYDAKYNDANSELLIPAPLSDEMVKRIRSLAIKAYKAIDCAGMARVDFFFDQDTSEIYLGEVNTIPGFTKISMYPKLWEASGLPYPRLIDRLVDLALERKADRDRTEWRYKN